VIPTRRGLWILAAIAAVLAIWVAVDLSRSTAPVDRALVPGFDPARVTRLVWPDVEAIRTGDTWKQGSIPLDADAIADVLRTLQAARWHRRASASSAGQVHRMLTVDRTPIGIGRALEGTDQVWLVIDGEALLVDAWVARALDRTPLELRVRHPLASVPRAQTLAISTGQHTIALAGHPRRYGSAGEIASAPDVHEIERQLANLEIVAIPAHVDGARTGEVHADALVLELRGACEGHPELVAATGTYGDGCIPAAAWQSAAQIVDERLGEAHAVDPRPVPIEPVTATLLDGTVITFGPPPRAGDKDADRDTVEELRRALTRDATIMTSSANALGTIAVVDRAGTHWDVEVLPGNLVRRTADKVVLRIAAWPMLQRPDTAYLDPTRWSEDRFAITEITLDGVTYARGAVVGEWTRTPPGTVAADKLEALAAALAIVRAPLATETAKPSHKLTVKLAPPVGEPAMHTLEVGAGCLGAVDGQRVRFEPALCTAISAVAK
jgi:hypothetical protein